MTLTLRQQRFCDEYALSGNGAEAARRAGYSEKTARQSASENLTKPYIKTALQARQQAYAAEMELTRQDVIQAILGAIQAATEQGAPATMIRGWVEIAKISGLDKPDPAENRRNMPLSPGAQRVKSRIEAMSTNELLELVAAKEEAAA
jgi:phage terminase small subunit